MRGGWRYLSYPVAIRVRGHEVVLERVRLRVAPDGASEGKEDSIALAVLTAAELEREGAVAGLRPEPRREIPETTAHLGSTVVMLRG